MVKPAPIALVVCDDVYREPTGKTALVGLFNRIVAQKFPAKHSRLCIYAAVTGVRPETEFKIRLVHSETDNVVAELRGPPPKDAGPASICDFMFVLQGLEFRDPGRHYIEFWANDNLLLQRPFEVEQARGRREKGGRP